MGESFNTAQRLYELFNEADSVSAKTVNNGLEGWCEVFDVPQESETRSLEEVARLIRLVDQELDQLGRELSVTGVESELYNPEVNRLRKAIDPMYVSSGWNNVQNRINSQDLRSLEQFTAHLKGSAPERIPDEDLKDVREGIEELSSQLQEKDLPPWFIEYVRSQLQTITQSLREYRIVGRKAFGDALRELATEEFRYTHEGSDQEVDEEAESIYSQFQELTLQLWTWYEVYCTSENAVEDAHNLFHLIKAALPEEDGALLAPPSEDAPQLPTPGESA